MLKFRCSVCGKLSKVGRVPAGGDGSLRYPRSHRNYDGVPCPGNWEPAEWVEVDDKKPAKARDVWMEEYKSCGCSNVTATKKEAIGYCPKHANDRRRITKLPPMPLGFVGIG